MFYNLLDGTLPKEMLWDNQSLDTRLDALRRGKPRIAWLYEKRDTSTFRYRCFNPPATLEKMRPDIGAAWFERQDIPALIKELSGIDVLVICRFRYDAELARLIVAANGAGTRLLFDCDDMVFDINQVHLVLDTLDQPTDAEVHWDFWFAYFGRMAATARLCEAAITTNEFLAARISQAFPYLPVHIVPNYFAPDQEEVSRALLAAKRKRGFQGTGDITIGYFSGTPTHNKDFAIAVPALARLMAENSSVRLRIVGFPPPSEALQPFMDRVEILPLQDPLNLQRVIAEVEINIAPLQDNLFTNCKSELKFFEAAAVGTWTIATPTLPFRHAIQDGVTGRLARAHEWDLALAEAIELVSKPEAYAEIAEKAASDVYDRYGSERQVDKILAAVGLG